MGASPFWKIDLLLDRDVLIFEYCSANQQLEMVPLRVLPVRLGLA